MREHHYALLIGRSCVTAALMGGVVAGCESSRASGASAPAVQWITAIDISGSRPPGELAESKTLLDRTIDRLHNGDRLVLIEMYQGGRTVARQWDDSIAPLHHPPNETVSDRRRAADFHEDARATASTFFDPKRIKEIQGTDILGTLFRAADYAKSAQGRRTVLLVLSDMLNATPELNMEKPGAIPGPAWIADRAKRGILPDLHGTCVAIVGADVKSDRGAAVRDFWERYFQASGAQLRTTNYRNMISDPREIDCR